MALAEIKHRLYPIRCVRNLEADVVTEATVAMQSPITEKLQSITTDNGSEYATHDTISKALKAGFYFAHLYSLCERRTELNHNGILRNMFPEGKDLHYAYLMFFQERLSNRPR